MWCKIEPHGHILGTTDNKSKNKFQVIITEHRDLLFFLVFSLSLSVVAADLWNFDCISLVLGTNRFSCDVEDMIGRPISSWWTICWKFLSPLPVLVSKSKSYLQTIPYTFTKSFDGRFRYVTNEGRPLGTFVRRFAKLFGSTRSSILDLPEN